jgi:hypothetical protein
MNNSINRPLLVAAVTLPLFLTGTGIASAGENNEIEDAFDSLDSDTGAETARGTPGGESNLVDLNADLDLGLLGFDGAAQGPGEDFGSMIKSIKQRQRGD